MVEYTLLIWCAKFGNVAIQILEEYLQVYIGQMQFVFIRTARPLDKPVDP